MKDPKQKYIAFLRGINVGGHHKVPMVELKKELEAMGFDNIITILNSGNVIFEVQISPPKDLEEKVASHLNDTFGFPIPTIIVEANQMSQIYNSDPFHSIEVHKDIRLYISFLKENKPFHSNIPWKNDDGSFQIILAEERIVLSILDLSVTNTPKAMEVLEKHYGKDITTRNWNTIVRIEQKLTK